MSNGPEEINEGDAIWADFSMLDKDDEVPDSPPTSLSYQVDCVSSNTQIKGPTTISPPVLSGEIMVAGSDNMLVNATKPQEMRRIMLVATFGTGDQKTSEIYFIVNKVWSAD